MLAVRLGQPEHLTPTKSHQRRGFCHSDPARRQIPQHAHPVDLRPAHRNHRHRPKTPQPKPWRVTSLSGPTVTSLSGVYTSCSHNERLWNGCSWRRADPYVRCQRLSPVLALALTQRVQLCIVQSLRDISDQIGRVFDADRQPDRGVENAYFLADVAGTPEWVMLAGRLASDSVPP